MCDNLVCQCFPKGFGFKLITIPCGSTSVHGDLLLCDECTRKMHKRYPQGWRNVPGDTCVHGNYVGDSYGPDYLCGRCENGE